MPTIDANSSFNIEGNDMEKEKSAIDFSALHIFEVLAVPHNQNETLLSAVKVENDFYIEENHHSFIITDDHFKKANPVMKASFFAPIPEVKITEKRIEQPPSAEIMAAPEEVIVLNQIENTVLERVEENEIAAIVVDEIAKNQVEEALLTVTSDEVEKKTDSLEDGIFIAENTENTPSTIVSEFSILEKTAPPFLENIDKEDTIDKKISKKEIILHKKQNLRIKIVVNEAELAQYFEPNEHFSFTETDNMSPETTSIIDRFLQNEPKLSRSRIHSAQKSAPVEDLLQEEDEEIVTETMAHLYATQGNKLEAIRIYEKLSLQFPEKRVYFAARIKTLITD